MTHVLVPIDGSETATEALQYALELFESPALPVLYVIELGSAGPTSPGWLDGELQSAAEAEAESALEEAAEIATATGASVETAVGVGRPARSIVDQADDREVDHIVMGSHGRDGASRLLLGSVAETVVRRAPVPVTVVR